MQNIAVVEDVIRRGKDDAGLYGSPEFLAAVRHIKCNDLPAWMRLRSEIKREKPSGVRLLDIDRLSDEEDDYFVEVRPNTSDTLVRIVKNSCELCFDEDLREAFVTIPEVGSSASSHNVAQSGSGINTIRRRRHRRVTMP